jgi:hypothetical protein
MAAPGVSQVIDTEVALPTGPPLGLITGVATVPDGVGVGVGVGVAKLC